VKEISVIQRALSMLWLALILVTGVASADDQLLGVAERTVAERPSATLLLPYFEVGLGGRGGTTRFTIGNAFADGTVAHVTLWSDLAVPVLNFNVYLTGYDLVTVDLRDVLDGVLPQTADAGNDPADTISPNGPFSQDLASPGCAGLLPPPPLSAADVTGLRAALTGQPSGLFGGQCCGQNLGTAWPGGFVTVDVMNACTAGAPGSTGYFVNGGTGLAGNRNVLWGDFSFDRGGRGSRSVGGPLVHVVADGADPELNTPNAYTFYGTQVGWSAADKPAAPGHHLHGPLLRDRPGGDAGTRPPVRAPHHAGRLARSQGPAGPVRLQRRPARVVPPPGQRHRGVQTSRRRCPTSRRSARPSCTRSPPSRPGGSRPRPSRSPWAARSSRCRSTRAGCS
jgi:hypothetical protein